MYKCAHCRKRTGVKSDTCPKCGRWSTLVFDGSAPPPIAANAPKRQGPQLVDDVSTEILKKVSMGLAGWDFLFSGGLAPGQVTLLAGEPGCGKTSAMLSVAPVVAGNLDGQALYISSEMPEAEMAVYAKRIGCRRDNLLLYFETDAEAALEQVRRLRPRCIVWDSIQRFQSGTYRAGSQEAIVQLCASASSVAKQLRAPTFFLSQVGKDNYARCPRGVDHDVDTVAYLEPKLMVIDKSRYGVARSVPREIPGFN